ncbi:Bax inhibitor-1/YccA family protein [Arenibaculum pallidiluteum]|uniref:Bax inhibitor-1/YccA family protein n=1 Tax=Arenibaculum pallidiluteum TaxID=2812559 RepID=UPI001A9708FA|nr:Bax inhibitor-1/YccA family protein [Arenibaculum pallidiluteum]
MATGPFNRYAAPGRVADQAVYDAGLRTHMLRVFNYMTGGLAVTGLVAFMTSQSPAMLQLIFGSPLKWVVMLAPLAFVFFISFRLQTISSSTLQALFWAFSAVMGLSMAAIFLVFTGASIARVFFISAGMFAGTALWGYTTRRDLTGMGSFLLMGLIGIVIAGLVNIFVGSSALQFAISVIGVLVFTGLTAFDVQRIKETFDENWGVESNNKLAIFGALSLYLNFINLFTSLLNLFGQRE